MDVPDCKYRRNHIKKSEEDSGLVYPPHKLLWRIEANGFLVKIFCCGNINRFYEKYRRRHLRKTKAEKDSSESCELEAYKQAKIVLCVLSSACRLSSQISPKIQGLTCKQAVFLFAG